MSAHDHETGDGARAVAPARPAEPTLLSLALVRNEFCHRLREYNAMGITLKKDDRCVIEGERGPQLGVVERGTWIDECPDVGYPRILRKASDFDLREAAKNRAREPELARIASEAVGALGLPMKLVKTEALLGVAKVVFYFTAPGRVDFRELVKDLGARLRCRIEMRQIGVRDAAGMVGGLGPCGKSLCCSEFLHGFAPITIRMAKNQDLPLNPQKVSGMCGRLMCCLQYEDEMYVRLRRNLPVVGATLKTARGDGQVIDRDVLKQRVRVALADGARAEVGVDEVKLPDDARERAAESNGADETPGEDN